MIKLELKPTINKKEKKIAQNIDYIISSKIS